MPIFIVSHLAILTPSTASHLKLILHANYSEKNIDYTATLLNSGVEVPSPLYTVLVNSHMPLPEAKRPQLEVLLRIGLLREI